MSRYIVGGAGHYNPRGNHFFAYFGPTTSSDPSSISSCTAERDADPSERVYTYMISSPMRRLRLNSVSEQSDDPLRREARAESEVGERGLSVVSTDSDLGGVEVERQILERAGVRLEVADCSTIEDVIAAAQEADGLLVQFAPVTARVFEQSRRLRAVVRLGTGLDNIDIAAAGHAGVAVHGISGYCTDEVADHTIALLLAITRGIAEASAALSNGGWKPAAEFRALSSLAGMEIGLVGFGRIGRAFATRAAAFGMHVGAFDPYVTKEEMALEGIECLTLEQAFRRQVVSLHLPLLPNTAKLIGHDLFALMPEGSIFLNVSRGGLVDEDALHQGLERGRPAFAGLDVLEQEPPEADNPLLLHARTLITPHIAFASTSAQLRLRRRAAETMVEALRTSMPQPAS
jgi:D-3-phosphoglycerate dehydrogenase